MSMLESVRQNLMLFAAPTIMAIGLVGNCLSALVYLSRKCRKDIFSVPLVILACTDSIILLTELGYYWLKEFSFNIRDQSQLLCKLLFFLAYVLWAFSSWLIVFITWLRVISTHWPLKANCWLTKKKVAIGILLLCALLVSYALHIFWGVKIQLKPSRNSSLETNLTNYHGEYRCSIVSSFRFVYQEILPISDLVLILTIPFALILIGNLFIVHKLIVTFRMRKSMLAEGQQQVFFKSSGERKVNKVDKQMTTSVMLVGVSIAFVVLTGPHSILRQVKNRITVSEETFQMARTICFLLYYSNNAVNFFVYCFSGSSFRKNLAKLFGCKKKQITNTQTTNMTLFDRSGRREN